MTAGRDKIVLAAALTGYLVLFLAVMRRPLDPMPVTLLLVLTGAFFIFAIYVLLLVPYRLYLVARTQSLRGEMSLAGVQIRDRIHEILLHQWGPMDVLELNCTQDKYDDYIETIHDLIKHGSLEALVTQLEYIETKLVGIGEHGHASRLRVAQELKALVE